MKTEKEAHHTVSEVFSTIGVPNKLVMDNSKTQTKGDFHRKCVEADCPTRQVLPYSPWANAAEGTIREGKKASSRSMWRSKAPKRLWDDCLQREGLIRSHTALDIWKLDGQTPETIMTGEVADISSLVEFDFYEWCYYLPATRNFPEDTWKLGRYLLPSDRIGPVMTAKILAETGEYTYSVDYRPLTPEELTSPVEIQKRQEYDDRIAQKLGPAVKAEEIAEELDLNDFVFYEDDETPAQHVPEADDDDLDTYDFYINAEVDLPVGGETQQGRVMSRVRGGDGTFLGKSHLNPMLDTRSYTVQFPNGDEREFSANQIAEGMYAQCDSEGIQHLLLKDIVDHKKKSDAVRNDDAHIIHKGKKVRKKSTRGWDLCVEWKNGTTTWVPLADLKNSYPVELAEYAVAQDIAHEPAFAWWIPYTLKKRERIIAKIKTRYQKTTHKFGIQLPKSVKEAYRLDDDDRKAGGPGDRWAKAIEKEMKAIRVAIKVLEEEDPTPVGYQEIRGHMVFDIKMDSLQYKARYCANGNETDAPSSLTYASVVSRESVRIALTIAALNDLEVKTGDIANAYLTAPPKEKVWIRLGPEFGSDEGKRGVVVRALYGLKSAGASFRSHLATLMHELGYKPCRADNDLWYKPQVRPDDGFEYYSYVLLYVDDALVIHHDALSELNKIDYFFGMKESSVGDPDVYLGGKLRQVRLPNGVTCWTLSPSKYVQAAVKNAEKYLAERYNGRKLAKKANGPMRSDYKPELDVSPELNADDASYFQSQIGILRWMVELGRVDIMAEVSVLSSHIAMPREGHLDAVFHLYAYLKIKHNSRMAFDPTYPDIDLENFPEHDWQEFYGDVKEALPPDMPMPRGREVDLRIFVDSDHAGDAKTRRSRTCFYIYLNMAPIVWYSKKQATIETSVFGAEFVAMKVAMETCRGIRYKLRMMGVPIAGPTYIHGDNMSVIHNTQTPESTLKKKSNEICYHAVRESVAMGESRTGHIRSEDNPADLGSKLVPPGAKRDRLVDMVLYDTHTGDSLHELEKL